MKQRYCNDQAFIAEVFQLEDEYIIQNARLAFFKINSYKLSMIKESYIKSKIELSGNIKKTLLNYTEPAEVLADMGFFKSDFDN